MTEERRRIPRYAFGGEGHRRRRRASPRGAARHPPRRNSQEAHRRRRINAEFQYLALGKTPSKDSAKKSEKDSKKDSKDSKSLYPGGQRAKTGDRDEDGKTSMRDDTFAVGDTPRLVVRGFNGRIRVRAGEPGSIRVRAKAEKTSRNQIQRRAGRRPRHGRGQAGSAIRGIPARTLSPELWSKY